MGTRGKFPEALIVLIDVGFPARAEVAELFGLAALWAVSKVCGRIKRLEQAPAAVPRGERPADVQSCLFEQVTNGGFRAFEVPRQLNEGSTLVYTIPFFEAKF